MHAIVIDKTQQPSAGRIRRNDCGHEVVGAGEIQPIRNQATG